MRTGLVDTTWRRAQRPMPARELLIGLATFAAYIAVDLFAWPGRRARADGHAELLVDVERWLNIDVERWLNEQLQPHHLLSVLANYEYAFTYILSALALLIWLFWRHPEEYVRARQSFVVLNLAAITCFALFPVTPPRLLSHLGYVDTVARDGTAGSWGSPLVDLANQLAAIPSLHVAWALWVSLVLARLARGIAIQVLSGIHVALTVLVVAATANHYLLDAIVAVPFVWWSVWIVDRWTRNRPGRAVPSSDAFFLHVETPAAPQHVGGVATLEEAGGDRPTIEQMRALVRSELSNLPRFTQRLYAPSRWRRARWVQAERLDWDWHVSERRIDASDLSTGMRALDGVVAELATEQLPRDRPMWRIIMARGVGPGRSAMIILVHHAMADGIGTVIQALQVFRPRFALPSRSADDRPGRLRTALGTTVGIAQLATDGRPSVRLDAGSPRRSFASVGLDLESVRRAARSHHVRVTDVVLGVTAAAIADTHPDFVEAVGNEIRTSVPVMVQSPDTATDGNLTATVMVDLPLAPMPVRDRLREVARRSEPLRTPTRALAARFVMASAIGLFPEPAMAWFAHTVYGGRFFQAVVSNMPGPTQQLTLCDIPLGLVVPILPLAPGAPVSLGALSWNGVLGIGLATDPEVLDATKIVEQMPVVLDRL